MITVISMVTQDINASVMITGKDMFLTSKLKFRYRPGIIEVSEAECEARAGRGWYVVTLGD